MEKGGDIRALTAGDVMTRGPVSIPPATLAAEALNIMEERKITSIVVVDGDAAARGRRRAPARPVAHGDVLNRERY